jgi:hypothetical protein
VWISDISHTAIPPSELEGLVRSLGLSLEAFQAKLLKSSGEVAIHNLYDEIRKESKLEGRRETERSLEEEGLDPSDFETIEQLCRQLEDPQLEKLNTSQKNIIAIKDNDAGVVSYIRVDYIAN